MAVSFNMHQEDFDWLLSLEKKGEIRFEWINHTYNHRWDKKLPVQQNFILEKDTNVELEILKLEARCSKKASSRQYFFGSPGWCSTKLSLKKL